MTEPLEVECEGHAFQLRGKIIIKSREETSIKEILESLIEGRDMVTGEMDDVDLDKVYFKKADDFKALEDVKQGLATVNIWFLGKVMRLWQQDLVRVEQEELWRLVLSSPHPTCP